MAYPVCSVACDQPSCFRFAAQNTQKLWRGSGWWITLVKWRLNRQAYRAHCVVHLQNWRSSCLQHQAANLRLAGVQRCIDARKRIRGHWGWKAGASGTAQTNWIHQPGKCKHERGRGMNSWIETGLRECRKRQQPPVSHYPVGKRDGEVVASPNRWFSVGFHCFCCDGFRVNVESTVNELVVYEFAHLKGLHVAMFFILSVGFQGGPPRWKKWVCQCCLVFPRLERCW